MPEAVWSGFMNVSLKNIIAQPAPGECVALHHLDQMPAPIKSLVGGKLAALRNRDVRSFEDSTARIRNSFFKSECSDDIDTAQSIIAEQKALRGYETAAPLQSHLDAAIGLTPLHSHAKGRFDDLRRQGLYPVQIIGRLAAELQISPRSVQHLLLTAAKFTAHANRNF
jgi:hypothetical protein